MWFRSASQVSRKSHGKHAKTRHDGGEEDCYTLWAVALHAMHRRPHMDEESTVKVQSPPAKLDVFEYARKTVKNELSPLVTALKVPPTAPQTGTERRRATTK